MDKKIFKRVCQHARYVERQMPNYLYIFTALQGSQNYNLATEASDVDTKTLVVPTFEELVFAKKRISTTLEIAPTIEHADVKDVREMFSCFRKQNINFLEILFTPYVCINPLFRSEYETLIKNREAIAHMNLYQGLQALIGNITEKYKTFDHITEKFYYNPKSLCYMLYLQEFCTRFFVNGDNFQDCLIPQCPANLLAVKNGTMPYEYACHLREEIKLWSDEFLAEWKQKLPNQENAETRWLLDELTLNIFFKAYEMRDDC